MTRGVFTNLHVHTEYSALDGLAKIDDYLGRCKELGQTSLAITDHGETAGWFSFQEKTKQAGVKPIFGIEVYQVSNRFVKKSENRKKEIQNHLTLLAKDSVGFKNLLRISSEAYLSGFYYKPRVDWELLEKYSDGVIALSGCLRGLLPYLFLNHQKPEKELEKFLSIFGDRFYLELQANSLEDQRLVNEALFDLSKRYGVKCVVTGDAHYAKKEDFINHETLLCIQTGFTLIDPKRFSFGIPEFHLLSVDDIYERLSYFKKKDIDNFISTTKEIVERIESVGFQQTDLLPKYTINDPADGFKKWCHSRKKPETNWFYLVYLLDQGWKKKLNRYATGGEYSVILKYKERLKTELKVIKARNLIDYFLIVKDYTDWAKNQNILVGPARGSVAGSLIAYLLDITRIDPLKYGLFFERFLNVDRSVLPDIDIDFEANSRDKVKEYIIKRFGENYTSQIGTYSRMKMKAALKDGMRASGVSYMDSEKYTKRIVDLSNKTIIKKTAGNKLEAEFLRDVYSDIQTDPVIMELEEKNPGILKTILTLENNLRQYGIHAAGLVISPEPIYETVGVRTRQNQISTQCDMEVIAKLGLLKLDVLGLKTLDVIKETLNLIGVENIYGYLECLNLNDSKTWELIQSGSTAGLFQIETFPMRGLCRQIKPKSLSDLAILIALYRPGVIRAGMIKRYLENLKYPNRIVYLHPSLEPILKETAGIIIYQEQTIQIAEQIGGLSKTDADTLRHEMSKKKAEAVGKFKDQFIKGCIKNGLTLEEAAEIFRQIERFGEYSFNKSHAVSYALLGFYTAYLKANCPTEFMVSLLNIETENLSEYLGECKRMKIAILPPDINNSNDNFMIVGKGQIRFGLGHIKFVGQTAISSILKQRPFPSFKDFFERIDRRICNKRVVESLIRVGAFNFFGKIGDIEAQYAELRKDKKFKKTEYGQKEFQRFEKDLLGLNILNDPVEDYRDILDKKISASPETWGTLQEKQLVIVGGELIKVKNIKDKKGRDMCFVTVSYDGASWNAVVFSSQYSQFKDLLKEENVVLMKGYKSGNSILLSDVVDLRAVKVKCPQ